VTAERALAPDRYARVAASPRGFAQSYVRAGRGGEPLVLVHGWPATARIWWRNVGPLAEAGFDVVAPDLRGFGESAVPSDGDFAVAAHSADLHALLRQLGLERVTLAGGDLGAAIACDFSLRFPGFAQRLVLLGPPWERTPDAVGSAHPATAAARRRTIAACYTRDTGWRSGSYTAEELDFHTAPFADSEAFRAGLAARRCARDAERPGVCGENPVEALLLQGATERTAPADSQATWWRRFPRRIGPFRIARGGRFPQWEAAGVVNGAIRHLCRPDPARVGDSMACVALGSNLGDRERRLAAGFAALRALHGVREVVASRVYETDPVGPGDQGPYLNAVARLWTSLSARALLEALLAIERAEGRERTAERNAPRTLDLDLLIHGRTCLQEPDLVVPHPRIAERPFVLEPLCDVAPDLELPGIGRAVSALAAAVRDPAAVRVRER